MAGAIERVANRVTHRNRQDRGWAEGGDGRATSAPSTATLPSMAPLCDYLKRMPTPPITRWRDV
jgi:hypothetical protein